MPPHKSVHAPPSTFSPVLKPASLIMSANSGCGGNLRIDSTRYWYELRSPARMVPNRGMMEKEYCSYNLLVIVLVCFRFLASFILRAKNRIVNFAEFETRKCSAWLQYTVGLLENGRNRRAVSNTKRDGVEVIMIIRELGGRELLRVGFMK